MLCVDDLYSTPPGLQEFQFLQLPHEGTFFSSPIALHDLSAPRPSVTFSISERSLLIAGLGAAEKSVGP